MTKTSRTWAKRWGHRSVVRSLWSYSSLLGDETGQGKRAWGNTHRDSTGFSYTQSSGKYPAGWVHLESRRWAGSESEPAGRGAGELCRAEAVREDILQEWPWKRLPQNWGLQTSIPERMPTCPDSNRVLPPSSPFLTASFPGGGVHPNAMLSPGRLRRPPYLADA